MIKKNISIFIGLLMAAACVHAGELTWKVRIISALPARADVPVEYCLRFSPDQYVAQWSQLQQTGIKAQNGILVKYRTFQIQQQNELFFTSIDAVLSKQLNPSRSWYTRLYIHLQQLTVSGIADGVWSTPDCKGRLIAEPVV